MIANNGRHDLENGNGVGFTNLPYREPIDIQFKDISYTVNLGFNKGKAINYYSLNSSGTQRPLGKISITYMYYVLVL